MRKRSELKDKQCERCGKTFTALVRELNRGKARFCGVSCANSTRNDPKRNPNWRKDWYERMKKDPLYPKQKKAHHAIQNELRQGRIKKEPCQVCGAMKVDAHHEDYDKPLDVIWLCRSHHLKHDRNRIIR